MKIFRDYTHEEFEKLKNTMLKILKVHIDCLKNNVEATDKVNRIVEGDKFYNLIYLFYIPEWFKKYELLSDALLFIKENFNSSEKNDWYFVADKLEDEYKIEDRYTDSYIFEILSKIWKKTITEIQEDWIGWSSLKRLLKF